MSERMLFEDESSGAEFSLNRVYRYRLWRRWGNAAPACFCMLNPSTANETELDPTLRRCVGFAKAWGCGGLEVVNLFAVVSPDPKVLLTYRLLTHRNAVGTDNDKHILDAVSRSGFVVFGWGAFPEALERAAQVVELLAAHGVEPKCLGTTAAGHPRHPLYLPKTAALVPWVAQ